MGQGYRLRLPAIVACQVVDHYLVGVDFDPVLSGRHVLRGEGQARILEETRIYTRKRMKNVSPLIRLNLVPDRLPRLLAELAMVC